jgi:hypothetical protein
MMNKELGVVGAARDHKPTGVKQIKAVKFRASVHSRTFKRFLMMAESQFDVFLCHNSEDKPAVRAIARQLQQNDLKPWLDLWELPPGAIWQYELERQIESIGAAAVFVGKQGIGPWQSEEIYAFLQEFIDRKCPVIPVMLSDAPKQPRLPIFLKKPSLGRFPRGRSRSANTTNLGHHRKTTETA